MLATRRWTAALGGLRFHLDEPTASVVRHRPTVRFRGWVFDPKRRPLSAELVVADLLRRPVELADARPDVAEAFGAAAAGARGFDFDLDLRGYAGRSVVEARMEFRAGPARRRSPVVRMEPVPRFPFHRGAYKEVWNAHAGAEGEAIRSVAGSDGSDFAESSAAFVEHLRNCVGVRPEDTVLEIGCGVGRVGPALAPLVREWIGADVSENMLAHARRRLAGRPNVRTVALSGSDLAPIPDASVDLVYSTTVFMHLDEWERWAYVREGMRVLRPGGRMLADNMNLLSDEGWALFLAEAERHPPAERPPHASKSSTPQELETYFRRAGFADIRQTMGGLWVTTFGRKPG